MHWTPPAPSGHPPQSTTFKSGWGFTVHKSYLEREAGFEFFLLPGRVHGRAQRHSPQGKSAIPRGKNPSGMLRKRKPLGVSQHKQHMEIYFE
ncbi:MAG TPA: hypothetical protein VFI68_02980 [Anaerolineales bacterium]|nr:hypothetical protein [Anaerolineales bacterium]